MWKTKIVQNKVYLPTSLREKLKVQINDQLIWEVKALGNTEFVIVSKDVLRGVRIVNKPKKSGEKK